jgi:pimeloyl-ACP methyl ester carboxylesterase
MLLLHGFLATPRVLERLASRLGKWGYCAHGVDLGGLFGRYNARPIDEIARLVAERVEDVVRTHGCERIDLIGHSEGGVLGRYYVQRLNGARRVRHLVTLGTPHRGTPWAYSGYVLGGLLPSLPQMAPGSSLLCDLADASFPRNVRLTSIYSSHDPFCPPASCRLDTGNAARLKNVEVTGVGHLAFLFDENIAALVSRELESVQGRWARWHRELVEGKTDATSGSVRRGNRPTRSRRWTTRAARDEPRAAITPGMSRAALA